MAMTASTGVESEVVDEAAALSAAACLFHGFSDSSRLAIVRHLVELHGGRVFAANRPSGGAQFTIFLHAGPRRA